MNANDDAKPSSVVLSDDQIEKIAERAKKKVMDEVYVEIGKGVVRRFLFLAGAALVALMAWVHGKGWFGS